MKEYTTAKNERVLSEMYYGDKFIMEAINQGLPLNTVVSTEIFKKLSADIYKDRIIVAPFIDDIKIIKLLSRFTANGGKLLLYGTISQFQNYPVEGDNVFKVDINQSPSILREKLAMFGYDIRFETQEGYLKLPAITINRCNNGLFFSIYNPDTTTDTLLKFPLGAPVLLGGETQIIKGFAKYRFARCEHRECRVFVQQENGILSAHEEAPVNEKYRRRFYVKGLKDATVYYFPEKYCNNAIAVTSSSPDDTPIYNDGWTPIEHPIFGKGFKGEHKNGKLAFLMPFKKYI